MPEFSLRQSAILLVAMLFLAACGSTSKDTIVPVATVPETATAAPGTPVRVVTTMSILADLIKQVGGERVQAENIIPIGAVAESYQPTPQDAQTIAQADVVFFNGHGLEAWIDDLFTSAGKPGLRKVELSKDLQAVDVGSEDFKLGNPHFWLNPQYATTYVAVIRDTLKQIDPAGATIYDANAASYTGKLNALDQELKTMANAVPMSERKLVTNHDAFPYFAKQYGFVIVGNILGNPEAALSAGDLADLITKIKAEKVKAIFSESQFNPKVSQALARDAGVAVIANLYTDTLGSNGQAASYLDMMRYDMHTIVDALTKKAAQ